MPNMMMHMDQAKLRKLTASWARQDAMASAAFEWTIPSRACSSGEDAEETLASMACSSLQYGGQQLHLSITPSTAWTTADLEQLSSLVQSRNKFVCMQLVTMVKEQYNKVAAAKSACDAATLHMANYMFLGTVVIESSGEVVAAGLFYPRQCSKDGVELPHMYVELLCCNSPGKGYGSVLLHHIEQYTACGCDHISAGFFGAPSSTGPEPASAGSTIGTPAADQASSTAVAAAQQASAAVLPVLGEGGVHADPFSGCCSACKSSSSGTGSSIGHSNALIDSTAGLTSPAGGTAAAAMPRQLLSVVLDSADQTAVTAAGGNCPLPNKSCCTATKCIKGIKLLSVESAQTFYTRNGYGAPDTSKEMFKPLPARDGVGSASSSSISSMMSVSSAVY